jgi:HD domain
VNLTALLASGSVKRFHATPGIPAQTVAEHSWRVALLARHLWGEPTAREWLLYLTHDCGEAWTGDVPAPFKWDYPIAAKLLNLAELEARESFGVQVVDVTPGEHLRLKIADGFELLLTALERRREGNQFADPVFYRMAVHLLDRVRGHPKELGYFAGLVNDYQVAGHPQATQMLEGLALEVNQLVEKPL